MTQRTACNARFAILSIAILLAIAPRSSAQSGRRLPRSAPLPTPEATPTPPTKKPEKETPRLNLIVGMDRFSQFNNPLYVTETILHSCADRLHEPESVTVEVVQRDMARGEAISRAKREKDSYVVWLQLRSDSLRSNSQTVDLNDLVLEYWVFSPTTADVKTSGRTYPQAYRRRGVIVNPRTSGIYGDYLLREAAQDAAERILAAFRVRTSPPTKSLESRVWSLNVPYSGL